MNAINLIERAILAIGLAHVLIPTIGFLLGGGIGGGTEGLSAYLQTVLTPWWLNLSGLAQMGVFGVIIFVAIIYLSENK